MGPQSTSSAPRCGLFPFSYRIGRYTVEHASEYTLNSAWGRTLVATVVCLLHHANKMRCSLSCAAICIAGVPMARGFAPASLLQSMLLTTRSYPARSLRTRATTMTRQSEDGSSSSSTSSDEDGSKTYRVVFLRHGESTWNRDDRHIGWTGKGYRYIGPRKP